MATIRIYGNLRTVNEAIVQNRGVSAFVAPRIVPDIREMGDGTVTVIENRGAIVRDTSIPYITMGSLREMLNGVGTPHGAIFVSGGEHGMGVTVRIVLAERGVGGSYRRSERVVIELTPRVILSLEVVPDGGIVSPRGGIHR